MSMLVGYKLMDEAGNSVIEQWGGVWGQTPPIPTMIRLPTGDIVCAPELGVEYNGYMLHKWMMDPPPPQVPVSITRRQCALQLFAMQIITAAEAVAMVQTGTPPALVVDYINALPTEEQRVIATINFAADNYYREDPTLIATMEANGGNDESIDQFFIAAAKL